MAFNAKYNKNRSVNARDAGFSQSKTFSPPLSSSSSFSSSFGMEFCPVDTFLRGAWQVWRKLWSRSGQTWSLKLFPNVIRTVMGTGKLESLGSAANLESFECVSPNFRGFWPSRKFSRNPNDFKTFGPSLNPRVIVSLSLLCLHFPLTISSTFSVSIPSSKRKIVRLRPRERSNRILPFFLFQRIKKDNPTQLLKYTDSKIIELLTLSNQSSTILWNLRVYTSGTEAKQTSSNKGKSVRKERKREEYEERTFAAFIGRFTRRNSRFHGGERKRFIGSVRTRKVSQPTNELLVPSWMNDRERRRRGSKDFSEAWKLIDRRTRLSLFRDGEGRGGGPPTHLLRLLFVAASSPVKTN